MSDDEIQAKLRELGRLVGKTYGAKGAKTTNDQLTAEERQAKARKAAAASVAARMKKGSAARKKQASEAARARWAKKEKEQ